MAEPSVDLISRAFPNLRKPGTFKVTSPRTSSHNCIAYAAGDESREWWPIGSKYWPPDVPRTPNLDAFEQAFRNLGFEPCESKDLEPDFEKVAIYGLGPDSVKHMAKQVEDGAWSSKLGLQWDIRHKSIDGVVNADYGSVLRVMKRKRAKPQTAKTNPPK